MARITRVYTDQPLNLNQTVTLIGNAKDHLIRVLRLSVGEPVCLFNGMGNDYLADITAITKHAVELHITHQQTIDTTSPLTLHLGQAVARSDRMDWVIQKTVELGVTMITPLITQRTQLDVKKSLLKQDHWQKVAISACEQCGRDRLPQMNAPVAVDNWFSTVNADLKLMLDPRAELTLPDLVLLASKDGGHTSFCPPYINSAPPTSSCSPYIKLVAPTSIAVVIGPEGGLTDQEGELAQQAGFQRIKLGPRILRTETAALAIVTLLQAQFGDLT